MKHYGVDYPVVRDVDGSRGRQWGVTGYPETFFIDRHGQGDPAARERADPRPPSLANDCDHEQALHS